MAKRLDKTAATDILQNIDTFLLDCDGVLWHGASSLPGSVETVKKLRSLGKKVFYVTNNSSKSRPKYVQKCEQFGFPAGEEDILCTAYAAALYLKNMQFTGKVYVVGNTSMGEELDKFGIRHTGIGPDPEGASVDFTTATSSSLNLDPEVSCVLVGFDPLISYLKILYAATYIRREGCLFLATNEDSHLPIPGEVVIPGTGTMVAAVKVAARKPPVVVGKPEKTMFEVLQKGHGLEPSRTMMVGDRCNTDMTLAGNCGLRSLLVFTGVEKLHDVEQYQKSTDPLILKGVPEFYTDCFGDLGNFIQ